MDIIEFEAFSLAQRAGGALASAPDQNRNISVARQSAKYLEERKGLSIYFTVHRNSL